MDNSKAVEQLLGSWSGAPVAEAMLIEKGIYSKPADARQRILQCIGCLWNRREEAGDSPAAFINEVAGCSKASPSGVEGTLKTLCGTNFIEAGPKGPGKRSAVAYVPSETEQGQLFREKLGAPHTCPSINKPLFRAEKAATTVVSKAEALTEAQVLVKGLSDFRRKKRIAQGDVAEATGIDPTVVSRMEQFGLADLDSSASGRTVGPTITSLVAYAMSIGAEIIIQPRSAEQDPPPQES